MEKGVLYPHPTEMVRDPKVKRNFNLEYATHTRTYETNLMTDGWNRFATWANIATDGFKNGYTYT